MGVWLVDEGVTIEEGAGGHDSVQVNRVRGLVKPTYDSLEFPDDGKLRVVKVNYVAWDNKSKPGPQKRLVGQAPVWPGRFKVNGESLYVWGSNRVFYPNSMRLIDEAAVKADPRLKPPSEIKSVAKDPLL